MLIEFWVGSESRLTEILEQFDALETRSQLFDSSEAEGLRLYCEMIAAQANSDEEVKLKLKLA